MRILIACGITVLSVGLARGQDVQAERTVSLKLANEMAAAAVEDCSSKGYNTVAVVVDRAGHLKALHRADNARPHAIDIAIRKAHTAAMLGYETRVLSENIQKGVTPASITHFVSSTTQSPTASVCRAVC